MGNTDAEGRMAMVDVLCHAKEKALHDPSKIRLLNSNDEINFDVNLILPESFHCEMYQKYTSSPTLIINLSITKIFNNHILFSYSSWSGQ